MLGLTASPSCNNDTPKIRNDFSRLTQLVEGQIYMPIIYENDLKQVLNRCEMTFYSTQPDSSELNLVSKINDFIRCFLDQLNPYFKLTLENKPHLISQFRNFLNSVCEEPNVQTTNAKRFIIASFIQKLVNSLEIMSIMGVSYAVARISESLNKLTFKKRHWTTSELEKITYFRDAIECLSGTSKKYQVLTSILKNSIHSGNKLVD